ncbi:hypothetical protein BHU72_12500 [Desulfuribacillus stibiiarsenatis]|uniref:SHS2 domain-containing protein n=1 Tax=Desulfuribacillus stibiiarsenatis TaxID=1390249 RepID=A0A1E5L260_9FIRM|nr:type IV pilus assembly protein PilM [Desulfuribacillus stibiiarsenatis]OEH84217.1 hypothetical protein BHU72_12500 [Desulfuribacillus stibiiarsenatis]
MKFLEKYLKKKIQHIGLDLGSYSIKMVELKQGENDDTHMVENYGMLPIPTDTIIDGVIKRPDVIRDALVDLKEERNIKNNATVTMAISGRNVITRPIKLPIMPLDELDQAVHFEAEKYIPTPLDQFYLDYTILGETIVDNTPHYNLLLAAVPKDMISNLIQIIESAHLKPYAVEIEPLSLYRVWCSHYYDEALPNQAILNMGHSNCHLVVFQKDNIQFTRGIPVAGHQITDAIVHSIGKEVAVAIDLKHKQRVGNIGIEVVPEETTTSPYDEYLIGESITDILSSLTQEIQRSIDFYQMQAKVRLDRLIITGGSSNLQGLDAYLEAEIGIPVLVGAYSELDPMYSLATGLAMREFMER